MTSIHVASKAVSAMNDVSMILATSDPLRRSWKVAHDESTGQSALRCPFNEK